MRKAGFNSADAHTNGPFQRTYCRSALFSLSEVDTAELQIDQESFSDELHVLNV